MYTLYQAEPASGLEEPTPLVSAVFPQSHKSGGYAQILMDTRVLSLLFMDALFSCGSLPQKGTPVDFSTLISGILGGKMKTYYGDMFQATSYRLWANSQASKKGWSVGLLELPEQNTTDWVA